MRQLREAGEKRELKRSKKVVKKAVSRNSLKALSKLADMVNGEYRIRTDPPVLVPMGSLIHTDPDELNREGREAFASYRASLRPDRRILLDRYAPADTAIKVVGVGSVGTRCLILLLKGRDEQDPLFLQIKEAGRSVLEPHLAISPHENQGERVVHGQRLMQSSSDIFLGWSEPVRGRFYYWRQLRDWKYSFDIDNFDEKDLRRYAIACGGTLAKAHARSGDPVAISSYLGKSEAFDYALAEFGNAYADQNERDYREFVDAIARGEVEAKEG
jgi:hypothetical protein